MNMVEKLRARWVKLHFLSGYGMRAAWHEFERTLLEVAIGHKWTRRLGIQLRFVSRANPEVRKSCIPWAKVLRETEHFYKGGVRDRSELRIGCWRLKFIAWAGGRVFQTAWERS